MRLSNWFVFFVQTDRERTVCYYLNIILNQEKAVAFIPKIELIYKNSRQVRKELKPMFPGYVFIDTQLDVMSFATQTVQTARKFNSKIYNLLGKQDPDHMALHEKEKKFILRFCDEQYIVRESIGFIEGDKVFVTSGPLQGKESIIKRIDRHKRRAEIELQFVGDLRRINISLEIVRKL